MPNDETAVMDRPDPEDGDVAGETEGNGDEDAGGEDAGDEEDAGG